MTKAAKNSTMGLAGYMEKGLIIKGKLPTLNFLSKLLHFIKP
jgi:hypothetical protein